MKLADLPPETLDRLRRLRYDLLSEKHEGPWEWDFLLRGEPEYRAEVLDVAGYQVLLPVPDTSHPNIEALRVIPSADGGSLTLFLADRTFEPEPFWAGRFAVCDRLPDADLYVAIAYHDAFLDDTVLWQDAQAREEAE